MLISNPVRITLSVAHALLLCTHRTRYQWQRSFGVRHLQSPSESRLSLYDSHWMIILLSMVAEMNIRFVHGTLDEYKYIVDEKMCCVNARGRTYPGLVGSV